MTDSHTSAAGNEAQAHVTRSRTMLLGVYLPVAITVIATLLFVTWLPQLPSPAAVHWGANGAPDRFGNPWLLVLMPFAIVVALCVLAAVETRRTVRRSGLPSFNQKFLVSVTLWLAVFLSVGMGGSIWIQRGLKDAAAAEGAGTWLIVGAVAGALLGVLGWFALPKLDRELPGALPVAELPVSASERVFWTGVVAMKGGILAIVFGVLAVVLCGAIVAALSGSAAIAIPLIVTAVILAMVCTTMRWRVTAGSHGVSLVSVAGWPALRVPLADISEVRLIEVAPVADFGGWGWRWAVGRTGVIMQAGPALEVSRTHGRTLVVPIDDAETAVSVLRGALARDRG